MLSCRTNPHGCYLMLAFFCDVTFYLFPLLAYSCPHSLTMFPLVHSQSEPYLPCITEHFLQQSWLIYPEDGGCRFLRCWYLSTKQNGVTPHKMVLMLLEILHEDDYIAAITAAVYTDAAAFAGK
jgi:hypothetical protein